MMIWTSMTSTMVMNMLMSTSNKILLLKMNQNSMRVLMILKLSRMMKKISQTLVYLSFQMRFFIFRINKIFKEKLYFIKTFCFNQEQNVQILFKYLCQF